VWHWAASGHSVTSGNRVTGALSGAFDSSPTGTLYGPGTYFSWKTSSLPVPSPVGYFCLAHRLSGMYGTVIFADPGTMEADFRITEVRYDGAENFVEIANLGDGQGDLIGFRLSINGAAAITPWTTSTPVGPSGERVVVSNPAGLGPSGSVALYAPNNIANAVPSPALTEPTMMIDYVEWGTSGGQPLEDIAELTVSPKVWTVGDFAPQAADGHAIVFCGLRHQYGVSLWDETLNPTPGLPNDCSNPVLPTSWGRLKTIYR